MFPGKRLRVYPVFFDSMGAKSSCIYIQTPDIRLLIDPGAAELQPSYPMLKSRKKALCREAYLEIFARASQADTIFISHYHYDHHTLPHKRIAKSRGMDLYQGKRIWIKDPNIYINASQLQRARLFFHQLLGKKLSFKDPPSLELPHPMEVLKLAGKKRFPGYLRRRRELLEAGHKWYEKLIKLWLSTPWIEEPQGENIHFVDGRSYKIGSTTIRFSKPLFHGLEYDRVGWVIALLVELGDEKFLYASDLQGPVIEDYAEWLVREDPDVLILDGPPTYLLGFLVNRINLRRVMDNLALILEATSTKLIIYDHHLVRDVRYRERLAPIYKIAQRKGKVFLTAREWLERR
jgi:hypothetical protein